jgi:hypothetical protein
VIQSIRYRWAARTALHSGASGQVGTTLLLSPLDPLVHSCVNMYYLALTLLKRAARASSSSVIPRSQLGASDVSCLASAGTTQHTVSALPYRRITTMRRLSFSALFEKTQNPTLPPHCFLRFQKEIKCPEGPNCEGNNTASK